MSPIKPPNHLPELVRATFNRAKASGDVNSYPTQVAVLTPSGESSSSTAIQLRFAPSLANKPKPKEPNTNTKPFNPFENPPPSLVITHLNEGAAPENQYTLVLNKFAIVPEHFLLITRVFKPQTDLLEGADLAAAYACIRAYHEYPVVSSSSSSEPNGTGTRGDGDGDGNGEREELFAFFNCGEHSGASQPHRHLQLLPIARMKDGLLEGRDGGSATAAAKWDVLADRLVHNKGAGQPEDEQVKLPFTTFGEPLHTDMTPQDLRAVYLRLYRKACAAVGGGSDGGVGLLEPTAEELLRLGSDEDDQRRGIPTRISYNMAMTKDSMVLCPRIAEGAPIVDAQGNEVGKLALNGTVLAGTALVKSEAEWNVLRGDSEQLWRILGRIGVAAD